MILNSIPDIRLFWSTDPRFLSQFECQTEYNGRGRIAIFKPYSRYPSCFKDVSFWLPLHEETGGNKMHENDLCDLVRDVAGDLVEDVKMVSFSLTTSESVNYTKGLGLDR
jgi:phenylalanyl-tRNA synthetase alpha chain